MHPGKGYRWLKVGDTISPGDEFYFARGVFAKASVSVGMKVVAPETVRRKLTMLPTDPTLVKRVETPHKELYPGSYLMSWGGFEIPVVIYVRNRETWFNGPSGYPHPTETVPDAKFYRLPEQLQ